jgi:hypothetical protein
VLERWGDPSNGGADASLDAIYKQHFPTPTICTFNHTGLVCFWKIYPMRSMMPINEWKRRGSANTTLPSDRRVGPASRGAAGGLVPLQHLNQNLTGVALEFTLLGTH